MTALVAAQWGLQVVSIEVEPEHAVVSQCAGAWPPDVHWSKAFWLVVN